MHKFALSAREMNLAGGAHNFFVSLFAALDPKMNSLEPILGELEKFHVQHL